MFKLSYRVAQFSALGAIFAICMWRKVLTFCIWQGLWFYIRTTAGILLIFVSSPVQIQSIKSLFFFSVSNAVFNISGSVQAAQGHWMLNSFKFICQVTMMIISWGMFLGLLLTWRMSCHVSVEELHFLFFLGKAPSPTTIMWH